MRAYRVRLNGVGSFVTEETGIIMETIGMEDTEIGSKIEIEVIDMTREELDALPEFDGF